MDCNGFKIAAIHFVSTKKIATREGGGVGRAMPLQSP